MGGIERAQNDMCGLNQHNKEKYLSMVVRKPNAEFLLRSSFLHFVHHANRARADTQTRSRSTYLLAKTPPLVTCVCIFYTFRATHLVPKRQILVYTTHTSDKSSCTYTYTTLKATH